MSRLARASFLAALGGSLGMLSAPALSTALSSLSTRSTMRFWNSTDAARADGTGAGSMAVREAGMRGPRVREGADGARTATGAARAMSKRHKRTISHNGSGNTITRALSGRATLMG